VLRVRFLTAEVLDRVVVVVVGEGVLLAGEMPAGEYGADGCGGIKVLLFELKDCGVNSST
jgi:hypothetical protein